MVMLLIGGAISAAASMSGFFPFVPSGVDILGPYALRSEKKATANECELDNGDEL